MIESPRKSRSTFPFFGLLEEAPVHFHPGPSRGLGHDRRRALGAGRNAGREPGRGRPSQRNAACLDSARDQHRLASSNRAIRASEDQGPRSRSTSMYCDRRDRSRSRRSTRQRSRCRRRVTLGATDDGPLAIVAAVRHRPRCRRRSSRLRARNARGRLPANARAARCAPTGPRGSSWRCAIGRLVIDDGRLRLIFGLLRPTSRVDLP